MEALGQGADGYEERQSAPRRCAPAPAIGGEAASGDEPMEVRMPLESAGPGVEHGEGADAPAEPTGVGAECLERIESRADEDAEQRLLVLAHRPPQLGGQREDDVEVWYGQQQLALALEPAARRAVAAPGAGAVMARVIQQMLAPACGALGEVSAKRTGAATHDRRQGAGVPARHGGAVPLEIVRPVLANDVGQGEHGLARLEAAHEPIEDLLQSLDAGLGDVRIELGGPQRLVAEDGLDGAQRDAGFEQVRRVAVAQGVYRGVLFETELGVGRGEGLLQSGLVQRRLAARRHEEVAGR